MQFINELPLSQARLMPQVVALYGVFLDEKLLYIGIASSLRTRFNQHNSKKKFDVRSVVKWNEYKFDEVEKLAKDELEAIRTYLPPLNRRANCETVLKTHSLYKKHWAKNARREHSKLHQATYILLHEKVNNGPSKSAVLNEIQNAIGLSDHWLDMFHRDIGGSPSVERIEKLYEYLAGKPLEC